MTCTWLDRLLDVGTGCVVDLALDPPGEGHDGASLDGEPGPRWGLEKATEERRWRASTGAAEVAAEGGG